MAGDRLPRPLPYGRGSNAQPDAHMVSRSRFRSGAINHLLDRIQAASSLYSVRHPSPVPATFADGALTS
uniref:Uncharacterized protein n=1 Tax=Rhodococcus hoagii TaxID=43767 RepID=A0A1Z1UXB1_RHOHA|nr:hypothetical protein pVAPN1572_0451 [Prescottella equi]